MSEPFGAFVDAVVRGVSCEESSLSNPIEEELRCSCCKLTYSTFRCVPSGTCFQIAQTVHIYNAKKMEEVGASWHLKGVR